MTEGATPDVKSKRLLYLEKLHADGKADSFGLYALALEYKGLGRSDDALAIFASLRQKDPQYLPMYLMCGAMLVATDKEQAKEWLTAGAALAHEKGDSKTWNEIQAELAAL